MRRATRAVVIQASWRVDAGAASAVVLSIPNSNRAPEPLREAHRVTRQPIPFLPGGLPSLDGTDIPSGDH